MSTRSRSAPWFRTPRTLNDVFVAAPPQSALSSPLLTHDLEPHCASPGCCVGVILGRCRRCGFIGSKGDACPATEDLKVDSLIVSFESPSIIRA
jgi:hypothetical protein